MMESHEKCSHSPEKEYSPEKECLPSNTTPRNETIFRYGEDSEGRDLLESTEILLSLSKSFDRGDGNKHNHNTRGSVKKELKPKKKAKKAKKVDDAAAANAPGKQPVGERPKSPPRIHHFHKQTNVSTFEVSYCVFATIHLMNSYGNTDSVDTFLSHNQAPSNWTPTILSLLHPSNSLTNLLT